MLSAYATPPQAGSSGGNLIFDRNAYSSGNAVTHNANSGVFTIQEPGLYEVSFHGSLAPVSGATFPLQILLYLQENGTEVPGTAVRESFHTSSDVGNASFSQFINVASAPVTLSVVSTGGNFVYSDVAMSVLKVGENG